METVGTIEMKSIGSNDDMNEIVIKNSHIKIITEYIENNLSSNFDTELLTRLGFISHTQLYRDFYCITGHSVKEYIRKRRLSNALALIKTSDISLADIAYECGYSSQQALCRVVKCALHKTPLDYKNSDNYFFFPPFDGYVKQGVTVTTETVPQALCIKFYHSCLKDIENRAINAFLELTPEYSGRIFGRNGKQNSTRFCYELYLTDTDNIHKAFENNNFEISHMKASVVSVFAASVVQNEEAKINAAWDYLYFQWLPNSMFEYTDEPYFEEYILKNGKPVKLKLYLPIKKRSEETGIILMNNPRLRFVVSKAKGYDAEKIASKTVMDYLSAHYPYIVKMTKEFYLYKEMNTCVCGVRTYSELQNPDSENVENFVMEDGNYLVLDSSVTGDYERYADMLLTFAQDNGMIAERKNIFAVYDVKDSYDNPKIRMYCKIKIGTK